MWSFTGFTRNAFGGRQRVLELVDVTVELPPEEVAAWYGKAGLTPPPALLPYWCMADTTTRYGIDTDLVNSGRSFVAVQATNPDGLYVENAVTLGLIVVYTRVKLLPTHTAASPTATDGHAGANSSGQFTWIPGGRTGSTAADISVSAPGVMGTSTEADAGTSTGFPSLCLLVPPFWGAEGPDVSVSFTDATTKLQLPVFPMPMDFLQIAQLGASVLNHGYLFPESVSSLAFSGIAQVPWQYPPPPAGTLYGMAAATPPIKPLLLNEDASLHASSALPYPGFDTLQAVVSFPVMLLGEALFPRVLDLAGLQSAVVLEEPRGMMMLRHLAVINAPTAGAWRRKFQRASLVDRPAGLPYVLLDSVVLLVPQAELDWLAAVWEHADEIRSWNLSGSPANGADPGLVSAVRSHLDESRLLHQASLPGASPDAGTPQEPPQEAPSSVRALVFQAFSWCGLQGRNSGGGSDPRAARALAEAAISTSLSHPNIVATYTYTLQPLQDTCPEDPLALSTPSPLSSQSPIPATPTMLPVLPLGVVLALARDVARGMAHLHSRGVVHADLSSANVLLQSRRPPPPMQPPEQRPSAGGTCGTAVAAVTDAVSAVVPPSSDGCVSGYVAKVCDFGLSGRLDPDSSATHLSGPARRSSAYSAPELVRHGQAGPAGDVYSFGVVLWELALGLPLPEALARPEGAAVRQWLAAQAALVDVEAATVLPPGLLAWPPHVPSGYPALVKMCLREQPGRRPTFGAIVKQLGKMMQRTSSQ
ncbi:hypothetical protein GPECTOR_6g635 [Gonium pectorale]|uniref:Protein kinase domain-containing protein n=1 Tax=Gonium pectorale TaxID=33097 RepID=A0A150GVK2_GONPE|nr:hypothetical protein GPECTOR_6g635 [Gonium pectorale]|eukprot:KXZ53718.1 hypothetical protein GPECTOR_6g635 [Gonium pectorale]